MVFRAALFLMVAGMFVDAYGWARFWWALLAAACVEIACWLLIVGGRKR